MSSGWAHAQIETESHQEDQQQTTTKRRRDKGRKLVCSACNHAVTTNAERIQVRGAHEHSFFNPHGIIFMIGCFSRAPGCQMIGPSSDEFTWFPGFRWRVAHCGNCRIHLGWSFAGGEAGFFGLILDRLHEAEEEEPDS